MNVAHLDDDGVDAFECRSVDGRPFPERFTAGREVRVNAHGSDGAQALIACGDDAAAARIAGAKDARRFDGLMSRGLPSIAWIAGRKPDGRVIIRIRQFTRRLVFSDLLECGLDPSVTEQLRKRLRLDREAALAWIRDEFVLPDPDRPKIGRVLLSATSAVPENDGAAPAVLHGQTYRAELRYSSKDQLVLAKIVPRESAFAETIGIVEAPLEIEPLGDAVGPLAIAIRAQLDMLAVRENGFVELWRDYLASELARTLRDAAEIGVLAYTSYEERGGRLAFELVRRDGTAEQLGALADAEDPQLVATAEAPEQLLAIVRMLDDGAPTDRELALVAEGRKRSGGAGRAFGGRVAHIALEPPVVTLSIDADAGLTPPPAGVLTLSTQGDETVQRRRRSALAKLRSPAAAMPQLAMLVEGEPFHARVRGRVDPLSPRTVRCFANARGEGSPNEMQRLALDVALNTPDIALIQGPPGTGKTRVIAALIERLAELAEADQGVGGLVLLTSFQHEAVDQAAAGVLVNGLPPIRIRRKKTAGDDIFERWREGMAARLGAAGPPDPRVAALHRLQSLAQSYTLGNLGARRGLDLLGEIERLARGAVPAELSQELAVELKRLRRAALGARVGDGEADEVWAAVHAIRTDAIAFADDGPARAREARALLEEHGLIAEDDAALLRSASRGGRGPGDEPGGGPDEAFLERVAALREKLLSGLAGGRRRPIVPEVPDPACKALLARLTRALADRLERSGLGRALVIDRYGDRLRNEPALVREAVLRYAPVVAETCQGSARRDIAELRSAGGEVSYESVIVDEAARANPLDLFIPMVQASRRVILVGDHRQLPQILEESIVDAFAQEQRDDLRMSLFERLWSDLQKRHRERDEPLRCVTLDTQYRMHPRLGAFVSRHFYEVHDEPAIHSGIDDGHAYFHGIGRYTGADGLSWQVAVWQDVPTKLGGEQRSGASHSVRRDAEARALVRELVELLDEKPDLTFGVIAFYSAQVTAICESLAARGAMVRAAGGYVAAPGYEKRLRVGTVDAFQGREFDVVFLSMTRKFAGARRRADPRLGGRRKRSARLPGGAERVEGGAAPLRSSDVRQSPERRDEPAETAADRVRGSLDGRGDGCLVGARPARRLRANVR